MLPTVFNLACYKITAQSSFIHDFWNLILLGGSLCEKSSPNDLNGLRQCTYADTHWRENVMESLPSDNCIIEAKLKNIDKDLRKLSLASNDGKALVKPFT